MSSELPSDERLDKCSSNLETGEQISGSEPNLFIVDFLTRSPRIDRINPAINFPSSGSTVSSTSSAKATLDESKESTIQVNFAWISY